MHKTEIHYVQQNTIPNFFGKIWQTLTDMVIELRKAQTVSYMAENNPEDHKILLRIVLND